MRIVKLLVVTAISSGLLARSADAADRDPIVVYLHRGGGTLTAGWDDSAAGTSSLLWGHGIESLNAPRFGGSNRQWNSLVGCVRDKLSEFSIEITDERPASGDYIMAMVSGRPSLIGYPHGVSGIAPWTGDVIGKAIVFVFERETRNDPEATCTSAVHEIGHALGLEHAYLCEDPMSYLHGCGEKRFRDQDAWCGEKEPTACEGGGTQNSWRHLARVVGLKNGAQPPQRKPERRAEPESDPDGDDEPGEDIPDDLIEQDDPSAPAVAILSPRIDNLAGNGKLQIVVSAVDRSGISNVELAWITPEASYILSCGAMPNQIAATCRRSGKNWVFSLEVGVGERAFAARATDREGHVRITEGRTIWLNEN